MGDNQKACVIKKKKFCDKSCAVSFNNKNRRVKLRPSVCDNCQGKRCKGSKSGLCKKCYSKSKVKLATTSKGELFESRSNWQNARSSIQRNARSVLSNSNKPKECLKCKYSNHVECCHIKSVSDFPDTSLISEINSIDNLIWLCPNHHWEFDNNLLKL